MNPKRQSAVVTYTLQALLNKNKKESEPSHPPEILALLSRHKVGMEQGFAALKTLKASGATVYISMEESILDEYRREEIAAMTGIDAFVSEDELEEVEVRFSSFFIPVLSFSLVSDLLRFNSNRPFIQVLLWALMKDKSVSALGIGSNPYHSVWQNAGLNYGAPLLKHELKKQLDQLRGYGIQLLEGEREIHQHLISRLASKKRIITAEEVKQMANQSHSEVYIDSQTIITPLARDFARNYDIQIHEE
ncbi:hypothetical protein HNR44_000194 [Geomicrobium halophilum]|uniref:Ethanolamine utilization protein n=1 Tax=Geomicrobium halophilum TaxID=549000 RepID=A0A841PWL0_9BACL|nr:hypothetical protein [Geomicrobium halophilum]MBB6448245.1 hypothetical protein [Geomicrobium halophilum]